MIYGIKLTHIRTKKRLLFGNYSGDAMGFETKQDAEVYIKKHLFNKALNAKVVKL